MPRTSAGTAHHQRVRRALKRARGHRGAAGRLHRLAVEAVIRAEKYAFRDRRSRKREFRALWITRLTAACRQRGLRYSQLICALRKSNVVLNRKMLSEIAIHDPAGFDKIVSVIKPRLGRSAA